jgi:hypothetical protein
MLHEFRVDAAPQKEGSAGMTEVVPAGRGEAERKSAERKERERLRRKERRKRIELGE